MTGKLSNRKNIRTMARVMPYGKGEDVIFTIPDCDFQVGKRSTINDPEFRGLSGNCRVLGNLGVWRHDTHAADKLRTHTHTITHYCLIDIDSLLKPPGLLYS